MDERLFVETLDRERWFSGLWVSPQTSGIPTEQVNTHRTGWTSMHLGKLLIAVSTASAAVGVVAACFLMARDSGTVDEPETETAEQKPKHLDEAEAAKQAVQEAEAAETTVETKERTEELATSLSAMIQQKISESMTNKELDLSRHHVNDETALHVAWGIQKNKTWKRCLLTGNSIGSVGAAAIAQAAARHPHLEGLRFMENQVGDKGVEQLALATTFDNKICGLALQDNGIGPKGIEMHLESDYWRYCHCL